MQHIAVIILKVLGAAAIGLLYFLGIITVVGLPGVWRPTLGQALLNALLFIVLPSVVLVLIARKRKPKDRKHPLHKHEHHIVRGTALAVVLLLLASAGGLFYLSRDAGTIESEVNTETPAATSPAASSPAVLPTPR